MVNINQHLGFSPGSDRRYKLGSRRVRVTAAGAHTLDLLGEIYTAAQEPSDLFWLLRLRHKVRLIEQLNARSTLSLIVTYTDDPLLRLLAIWLRGRCGGHLGRPSLVRFAHDEDERLRREVARALRRMSAASDLRELTAMDSSAQVRTMAKERQPRPFGERLASFSSNVAHADIRSPNFPWFIAPEVEVGEPHRPKSIWFIRYILDRIHRLVSGISS